MSRPLWNMKPATMRLTPINSTLTLCRHKRPFFTFFFPASSSSSSSFSSSLCSVKKTILTLWVQLFFLSLNNFIWRSIRYHLLLNCNLPFFPSPNGETFFPKWKTESFFLVKACKDLISISTAQYTYTGLYIVSYMSLYYVRRHEHTFFLFLVPHKTIPAENDIRLLLFFSSNLFSYFFFSSVNGGKKVHSVQFT